MSPTTVRLHPRCYRDDSGRLRREHVALSIWSGADLPFADAYRGTIWRERETWRVLFPEHETPVDARTFADAKRVLADHLGVRIGRGPMIDDTGDVPRLAHLYGGGCVCDRCYRRQKEGHA